MSRHRTIEDCLGRWLVTERADLPDGRTHRGAVIEITPNSFSFSGFSKDCGFAPLDRCFDIDESRGGAEQVEMAGMHNIEDASLTLSWDAEGRVTAHALGCDVFGWMVTVPVRRVPPHTDRSGGVPT